MTNYNLHRQILSQADLSDFLSSNTFKEIESFLLALNESIKGVESDAPCLECSPLINWAVGLIEAAEKLVQEFPPQNRNADVNRFGNVAFRDWLFTLQEKVIPERMKMIPAVAIDELEGYFVNSLGSSQRIDYGTGHELHFLIFMMGLRAPEADRPALVLRVFTAYIRLMRLLQKTYWLEPAGSHGVWGLDDYHFLPFLFGSAQLYGHANIRPRAVHSPEMVHYLAPKYIYFDSILNILVIKQQQQQQQSTSDDYLNCCLNEAPRTNALRWMSPVLDDISAVKTWDKVNSGLIKMWRVEVMSKLPIMQHLLFGEEILRFKRNPQAQQDQDQQQKTEPIQHYTHSLRGDCCGNPLPSIYAAASKSNNIENKQPGLPFD